MSHPCPYCGCFVSQDGTPKLVNCPRCRGLFQAPALEYHLRDDEPGRALCRDSSWATGVAALLAIHAGYLF